MSGLIVDNFAGGGGASVGIERALGRSPDIAINHDAEAVAMHAANHPATEHYCQNIWQVDPAEIVRGGRHIELAWFSPDCKYFSKAKGGRPAKRHIRDLAWVVVHWAKRARPRVICLENVEEFGDWGPLDMEGRPCRERRGETFRRWVGELKRLGYRVDWRELRACDYGAPTIRKRLFLVARCDEKPITWPAPTHGPGRPLPYRTAAEIVDWSLACPSIFLTREQGRAIGCKRPLAEATLRRIAKGVVKYVLESADPFLVPRYGERAGQEPRTYPIREPTPTVVPTGNGGGLVVPCMASLAHGDSGGRRVYGPDEPVRTIHAGGGKNALVAAHLTKFRGESSGVPLDRPAPTVTANGYVKRPGGAPSAAVVAAFLAQHNTGVTGHHPGEPVSTIVQKGCTQGVVAAHMLNMKGADRSARGCDEPVTAACAGSAHAGLVAGFLAKYYGTATGQDARDPLHAATAKGRFGAVTVSIRGESYELVDIGMRMLSPRELFRAQGFPDDYAIDLEVDGRRLTKTSQIRLCGNSVCPDVAEAVVRAQFGLEAAVPDGEAAA